MFGSAENQLVEVCKNVAQMCGIKGVMSMAEFTVGCIFLLLYGLKGGYRLLIVQFSHLVVSDSLRSHGLQQARLPCPSPTPGACSSSCPLSW